MGLFGLFKSDPLKELFKGYERGSRKDVLQAATLISGNDPEIVKIMNSALNDPVRYLKTRAEQFEERGIDFDDEDFPEEYEPEELLLLAMVDELEEHKYLFEFDWKVGLEDLTWGLEQLKNYGLIADVMKTVKLNENGNIEEWGKEINSALGEKACVCYIDIDSDSYPVVILNYDILGKLETPFVTAM